MKMLRTLLLLIFGVPAHTWAQAPAAKRTLVIISDLHFGVGRVGQDNHWHAYEDFRWGADLEGFLGWLKGKGDVDLVLNGDSFELWQTLDVPPGCTSDKERDLGCAEDAALRRFTRVLSQHTSELALLKAFADSGRNRVIFVPGNHDAALLFGKLQRALLDAIGSPAVSVAQEGYWVSRDGKVFAEHGHQIGEDPNRMDGWPSPYLIQNGTLHLRRSWGEQFVQQVYNDYELKYPIIDNITEEATGVKYAIAREHAAGAVEGARRFLRFFLFGTSWSQFNLGLGELEAQPTWNFDEMRRRGDVVLVELLPEGEPIRRAAAAALKEPGGLGNLIGSMSNEELKRLCDKHQDIEATRARDENRPGTARTVCPARDAGAIAQSTFRARHAVLSHHLDDIWDSLGKKVLPKQFVTYVFSHTHRAEPRFDVQTERLSKVSVINTGAFQRVVTPKWLEEQQQRQAIGEADVLAKIPLEGLPACYNFVQIAPGKEREPWLMAWKQGAGGAWAADAGTCD